MCFTVICRRWRVILVITFVCAWWKYFQVFAALGWTAHPRQHASELRQWAGLPRVLAGDGHHHLLDDHLLRREERRQHQVQEHSGRLLVHHRHHDNPRVSVDRSTDDDGEILVINSPGVLTLLETENSPTLSLVLRRENTGSHAKFVV